MNQQPATRLPNLSHRLVQNNMVELYGKGMKQHFGIGIPFNIVSGFVQLFNNGLLLADAGDFVQPLGKVKFIFREMNIFSTH